MTGKGVAVAYAVTGGLILFSGIKGASISDTVSSVLTGNLTVTSSEPITAQNSGSGSTPSATGNATGQQILGDAMKYNGHKYVFGGPSNPTDGWDCSSFASYVLGHDLDMMLPGKQSWSTATENGKIHGPVADEFAKTPGFTKVGDNPKSNQPGDLLVWTGHVGFGTGNGGMFSAYDSASGTLATTASAPYGFLGVYRNDV